MLDRKQKYLQIALNSTIDEARSIIGQIPLDKRIILEAGTPLIKAYGREGIRKINLWWRQRVLGSIAQGLDVAGVESPEIASIIKKMKGIPNKGYLPEKISEKTKKFLEKRNISQEKTKGAAIFPYIVADLKCMDRGTKEVEIAKEGGASGAVALGHAPIETLDAFIKECKKHNLDAMIDMMNVEYPLDILRNLEEIPEVVILHRGVDEESFNPESEIPFHEIHRIKENYDIMVAVAGGDTFQEVQRAIFNDADIVVVWKSFYQSTAETAKLADQFLKEIR